MKTKENPSAHQTLVDRAYKRFTGDYAEFVFRLTEVDRMAVLLGNLNYQVNNGGFSQWVDNGYAVVAGEVVRALRMLNTDAANMTAGRIIRLMSHVNVVTNALSERGESLAEQFDKWYFDCHGDQLMKDAEHYFKAIIG